MKKIKLILLLECEVGEEDLQHLKDIAAIELTTLLELDHYTSGTESLKVTSLEEL